MSIYNVPVAISWMKIDDVVNGQNKKLVSVDVPINFFFFFFLFAMSTISIQEITAVTKLTQHWKVSD